MIYIPFIPTEIVFAVLWVIIRTVLAVKNKKFGIKRELMMLLMYVNLAVLLRITFFPWQINKILINPNFSFQVPRFAAKCRDLPR